MGSSIHHEIELLQHQKQLKQKHKKFYNYGQKKLTS